MPHPAAAFVPLLLAAMPARAAASLTADEVRGVVARAVAEAQAAGSKAWVAVVDEQANVLALYRMDGAPDRVRIPQTGPVRAHGSLEGADLTGALVAVSKAGAGALLSSGGNAFSSRTASFIVQDHFPPKVDFTPGGPLFGVQFSSLICTDIKTPALPYGLAGDPGGVPLYRDGRVVGGVGVESDGIYGIDTDPATASDADDAVPEERAALAGQRGFEPPDLIRGDNILADGIRLTYTDVRAQGSGSAALGGFRFGPRGGQGSPVLRPGTVGGVNGQVDSRFPIRAGKGGLSAADVAKVLEQAAQQTVRTRGAIRQPLNSNARVSIAVVDTDGSVLAFFQNDDAPNFGIDVSVQKARTAAFFSRADAGSLLRGLGLGEYVADVPLDGSIAYTSRAIGFLHQPFYPPGINGTDPGPFSRATGDWSPFDTGLQLELLFDRLAEVIKLGQQQPGADIDAVTSGASLAPCNASLPGLANGITIFPGGVPLYKDGRLVGAIGISGDGVDQDDLIASAGSAGFEAPSERRCDQLVVRGTRLPYVKYPRHPEL